ncbi:MAG: hypothetical protein E7107_08750 [Prevotella sp.]|jgi:hypothetical protein|nr:hypothetical protein [Prevotella sp.]
MKKVILIILCIVLVGLIVLAMMKPDRSEHYNAVKIAVANVVDRELHENLQTAEFATMGTMSTLNMLDDYLSKHLFVQDHHFYTVGMLMYQEMFLPISFGVLGQVRLTVSEDELKEVLKMPEIREMMKSKSVEDAVRLYMKKR